MSPISLQYLKCRGEVAAPSLHHCNISSGTFSKWSNPALIPVHSTSNYFGIRVVHFICWMQLQLCLECISSLFGVQLLMVCSSRVVSHTFLCSDANVFSSKGFWCVNTVNYRLLSKKTKQNKTVFCKEPSCFWGRMFATNVNAYFFTFSMP